MAFDPEAFAKGGGEDHGGFNPEAFAAGGVDTEPEETFLKPGFKRQGKKEFPAHMTAPEIAAQLENKAPQSSPADPLNSMIDRYTFGGYGGLLRIGAKLGVPTTAETVGGIEHYRAEHPLAGAVTDMPAYAMEGPAQLLAKGIGRGVEAAGRELAPASEFLSRLLRSRVGGATAQAAAMNAVIQGSQAASEGKSPREIAGEAGRGAEFGAALAPPVATLGIGLGALGRAIANTRGGQARAFLASQWAPVSEPWRPYGAPEPSPATTFDPARPIKGGDLAGMKSGEAIELLESQKYRVPEQSRHLIDAEIDRIKEEASAPVHGEEAAAEISRAQHDLAFIPPSHHFHLGKMGMLRYAMRVPTAISGRLLYPPALAAQELGPMILQHAPAFAAAGTREGE